MPFRSEKQRRYLWKNHPKIAKDWTDTYGSKPQPKKKAEGGTIRKRHATGRNTAYELADLLKGKDRVTSQDIKRAQTVLKGKSKNEWKALQITLEKQKKGKALLDAHKKTPSYSKGKEKAKEHKEKITKLGKKALGYVDGWLGKKKGGSAKKNGPVRPIHIPWDSQKKKKGGTVHPRNTGVAVPQKGLGSLIPKLAQQAYGKPKEKKYHFKKGGIMEPYRGSYISGKVDGKMLSNPSLRKYYKGLI